MNKGNQNKRPVNNPRKSQKDHLIQYLKSILRAGVEGMRESQTQIKGMLKKENLTLKNSFDDLVKLLIGAYLINPSLKQKMLTFMKEQDHQNKNTIRNVINQKKQWTPERKQSCINLIPYYRKKIQESMKEVQSALPKPINQLTLKYLHENGLITKYLHENQLVTEQSHNFFQNTPTLQSFKNKQDQNQQKVQNQSSQGLNSSDYSSNQEGISLSSQQFEPKSHEYFQDQNQDTTPPYGSLVQIQTFESLESLGLLKSNNNLWEQNYYFEN